MNRQQRRAAARRGQSPAFYANHGLALQNLGRLDEAVSSYDRAIALDPNLFEVHYNRANALRDLGLLEDAIASYERAIELKPGIAEAYSNRGSALRDLRRLEEAVQSYDEAVACNPRLAEVHYNRGNVLKDLGRPEEAVTCYDRAIELEPDMAEAYSNRGIALMDLNRLGEALESCDRALTIRPDYADALINRGLALERLKRFGEALAAYDRALAIRPNHADALFNRGHALQRLEQFDEALASYDRALAIRPDHAETLYNRALVLHELTRLDEALEFYDRALAMRPDLAEAASNRGVALHEAGRFEEALQSYDKELATNPDFAQCRFNRGALLLLTGRFAEGWEGYEWRRKLDRWIPRCLPGPEWNKSTPADKRLFYYAEQGLGDTIQFSRFATAVAATGKEVVLEVPPALVRLLSGLSNVKVIGSGEPPLQYDAHLPLVSLPRLLWATLETIPASVPYLFAEPARIEAWSGRLPVSDLRVGIAWQGKPGKVESSRSIPLRAFAPLCHIPGVTLISLQKHDGLDQLANLPPDTIVETLGEEFDAGPDAFLDCAGVMMNLDLVISSDTAVAHLAGALGRPIWVVLKHVPDWRWLLDRDDSPWYPTARLFRQRRPGDWDEVFERVAAELAEAVARKKAPRTDPTGVISN
jgi:tetratricopeptide (TPR) repeat protein